MIRFIHFATGHFSIGLSNSWIPLFWTFSVVVQNKVSFYFRFSARVFNIWMSFHTHAHTQNRIHFKRKTIILFAPKQTLKWSTINKVFFFSICFRKFCYDVSDDPRKNVVVRILSTKGNGIQWHIFYNNWSLSPVPISRSAFIFMFARQNPFVRENNK